MSAPVRGCGTRQPGGIYLVSETGEKGKPIEHFLIDPPRPIEAGALGIAARGVTLATLGDAPCVLDWVGVDSYPNVADFIEETRRFGASRRVQAGLDFSVLRPGARHLFVHPKALILNPAEYWNAMPEAGVAYPDDSLPGRVLDEALGPCVTRRPDHGASLGGKAGTEPAETGGMCATLWWHDLDERGLVYASEEGIFEKQVIWEASAKRQMPAFSYHAFGHPQDTRPRYALAAFLWLPIHRVVVIADPEGGTHDAALEKARRAGLPVDLEED